MLAYRLVRLRNALLASEKWSRVASRSIEEGLSSHWRAGGWTEAARGAYMEYAPLYRDLLDLFCTDAEVSGQRKILTVARMRESYKCLMPHIN